MDNLVRIELRCLLPTVFCGVKLKCRGEWLRIKWSLRETERVKQSIERQIRAARKDWGDRTSGKVDIDAKLHVATEPVRRINRRHHVKEPSVKDLLGNELYSEATCFMVWVPYPECIFEGMGKPKPRTRRPDDYMWMPTKESRELHDLEHKKPRCAARHELKHWLKNLWTEIAKAESAKAESAECPIPCPDGKDRRQYWPRLNDALTPENIAKLNKEISARVEKRTGATTGCV